MVAERITAEGEQLSLQTNEATSLQQALKKFNEALSLWRALGDVAGEAETLNEIGVIYDSSPLLDRRKSLDYFEQALSLWRAAATFEEKPSHYETSVR